MVIVELNTCATWSCPECGVNQVVHTPWRTLDPNNSDDLPSLVDMVEKDLRYLWKDAGSPGSGKLFSPQGMKVLDDVMMASVGETVDRYSVRYMPFEVECKMCRETFRTDGGDRVLSEIEDEDRGEGDDDDLGDDYFDDDE